MTYKIATDMNHAHRIARESLLAEDETHYKRWLTIPIIAIAILGVFFVWPHIQRISRSRNNADLLSMGAQFYCTTVGAYAGAGMHLRQEGRTLASAEFMLRLMGDIEKQSPAMKEDVLQQLRETYTLPLTTTVDQASIIATKKCLGQNR